MKKPHWKTSLTSRDKQAERLARRLRRMAMRLYKYAAKRSLWHVNITLLNDDDEGNCYVAVRAKYYDIERVDDYIFMPMIEEKN